MKTLWYDIYLFPVVISAFVAVVLARLALPVFNQLLDKNLQMDFRNDSTTWIVLACVVVSVGLLAGLYPALILSNFKPVQVLYKRKCSDRPIRRPVTQSAGCSPVFHFHHSDIRYIDDPEAN